MADTRIAVLGSGANGSSIGADLTRAGLDVTLIEQWPEHVEAMRENGVRIEMPGETVTVPVRAVNLCEVATFTRQFDIVLMLMKAYDSAWAGRLIEPYLKEDGILVGVQNGMTTDTVADIVGRGRTVGAVIEMASMMYQPGVVERHTPPAKSWFAVGDVDGGAPGRAAEIARVLELAGTVELVDDIYSAKWMKLTSNSTTLVSTAILGLPMLEAIAMPGMRELMIAAGQEALDAGVAAGYSILPIFGLVPEDVARPDRVVELLLDVLCERFTLPHTTTTILHDWTKGRHSEVDDINGLVVEQQRRRGAAAPVNAAIVEVAHRIERGDLKPDPANFALLRRLADADIVPSPRLQG
jgi:2-dehydropantoate 2-reductase